MGNKEWKVGDKALCTYDNKEYTIDGFTCCPKCGEPCIYTKEDTRHYFISDDKCGYRSTNKEREYYARYIFIRPDLDSLTSYKNQVSVREIPNELKKLEPLQNQ